MDELYKRLAARLDQLPHGFPPTESGVELRILRRIFSPAHAELALRLMPIPETAEAIAVRLAQPVEELRSTLDAMVRQGEIMAMPVRGEKAYGLAPFVIGIYEFQLPRMDAELAGMVEEYLPTLLRTVGGAKPALARVIPVNSRIDAQAQVLAFEDIRALIAAARSFNLQPCICRTEKAVLGQPCSHPIETCLLFSAQEDAYDGTLPSGYGRRVSRDEALAVVDLAEREGLVHCTYNVRKEHMFVCNCCSCCCGFLRAVKDFEAPHMLVRSNWVSAIDPDVCTACGACAAPRCPMDAVAEHDGAFAVDEGRCIGCGVCTTACPTAAVTLRPRRHSEQTTPPKTIVSWAFRRAVRRSGPLRAIGQFGTMTAKALASHRAGTRQK
jgi:H+/Na+-translocating ferredoxin:NAD+ oxidoreductase subunit B